MPSNLFLFQELLPTSPSSFLFCFAFSLNYVPESQPRFFFVDIVNLLTSFGKIERNEPRMTQHFCFQLVPMNSQ